jgi:hypothetical protein
MAPIPAATTAGPTRPVISSSHRGSLLAARPALRAVRDALVVLGLLFTAYEFLVLGPSSRMLGYDAWSYWAVDLNHLYAGAIGDLGWFPYSPALAQVASVFHVLSGPAFLLLWMGLLVATVVWLGGRHTIYLLAFPPVAAELYHANLHL